MNFAELIEREEVIDLTRNLIKIPSDWNQDHQEKNVLDYISAYLNEHGVEYRKQQIDEHRYNIIATYKGTGGGKTLLFNGHVDTVPPYEMDFSPCEAFIEEGHIHGRGAVDMKSAVAAMITTLVLCHRHQIKLSGDIIVSLVVGEETNSAGTEKLVMDGIEADGAIVGEPTNFDYAIGHRGLEWLEIEVTGKIAHSGVAEKGINAISKAAKLIDRLDTKLVPRLKSRTNPYTGPSILNYGKIIGGNQPSTVADKCVIQLDRRYAPGETAEQVIKEIQEIIEEIAQEDPDFKATVQQMDNSTLTHLYHVPMITDPDESVVKTVTNAIKAVVKKEPELSTRRGWTDGGLISHYANIPTVICGPGDISYSHSKNERIPIEQVQEAVEVYLKTAYDFCGSEGKVQVT